MALTGMSLYLSFRYFADAVGTEKINKRSYPAGSMPVGREDDWISHSGARVRQNDLQETLAYIAQARGERQLGYSESTHSSLPDQYMSSAIKVGS